MRKILGIDPGSRITGFAVLEQAHPQDKPICLTAGCIRLGSGEMAERLKILFSEIEDIVKTFQPSELAIEKVFMQKNVRSALVLGQARGVAIAAAMAASTAGGLSVHEYAPRLIKQGVVGYGNANKEQVIKMVSILLNLSEKPQSDAADAMAVALCHLHATNLTASLLAPAITARKRSSKRASHWKSYDRTTTR